MRRPRITTTANSHAILMQRAMLMMQQLPASENLDFDVARDYRGFGVNIMFVPVNDAARAVADHVAAHEDHMLRTPDADSVAGAVKAAVCHMIYGRDLAAKVGVPSADEDFAARDAAYDEVSPDASQIQSRLSRLMRDKRTDAYRLTVRRA